MADCTKPVLGLISCGLADITVITASSQIRRVLDLLNSH